MVKVRGQNSNSQTDGWKWPENLGWQQHSRYYVIGARHQQFEAAGSWIRPGLISLGLFFKVENNSLELTRIFKESFKDQRWAWEKSVGSEKRDRNAERERKTDDGVDAETSLSLSLHFYLSSPPLHFFLTLTFGL